MTVYRFISKHNLISHRILSGVVYSFIPKEIYLFYVDNWFDSKWLNFSGKVLGSIPIWNNAREENNLELTLPPFIPNRITGQGIFQRQNDGINESYSYKLNKKNEAIHKWQKSSDNRNRKIKVISTDALFIWIGHEETSDNGSTMIYLIKNGEVMTFYFSLKNFYDSENHPEKDSWGFDKLVGISQTQAKQYFKTGKNHPVNFEWE